MVRPSTPGRSWKYLNSSPAAPHSDRLLIEPGLGGIVPDVLADANCQAVTNLANSEKEGVRRSPCGRKVL